MYAKSLSVLVFTFASSYALSQECDDMRLTGVSARGSGSELRLEITAESTFIASTSSLIGSARRNAELQARQQFANWLDQELSADEFASNLMEANTGTTVQADGSVSVVATSEEIQAVANIVSSTTSARISGLVKLEECVDTNNKIIVVKLGWKLQLSSAAAQAASSIDQGAVVEAVNQSTPATSFQQNTAPSDGYRVRSPNAVDF